MQPTHARPEDGKAGTGTDSSADIVIAVRQPATIGGCLLCLGDCDLMHDWHVWPGTAPAQDGRRARRSNRGEASLISSMVWSDGQNEPDGAIGGPISVLHIVVLVVAGHAGAGDRAALIGCAAVQFGCRLARS